MRRLSWIAILTALMVSAFACAASAVTLQPIGSFTHPVFVTSDPGDPERLLVVEREGRLVETGPGGTRTSQS